MQRSRNQPMLTASEIGEYAFCAKAWKLKREGVQPDSPRLQAGTAYHRSHQAGLHWARLLRRLALAVLLLALAVALLWLKAKMAQ